MLEPGTIESFITAKAPVGIIRLPNTKRFRIFHAPQGAPDFLPEQHLPEGLVVAPFSWSEDSPGFVLPIEDPAPKPSHQHQSSHSLQPQAISSRSEYESQFYQMQEAFEKGSVHKAILSRVHRHPRTETGTLSDLMIGLSEAYPTAFVYLIYHPQHGCWMGATPETLLSTKDNSVHTMSLAGTRKLSDSEKMAPWTQKEIQEQAYVTQFVREQLKASGLNPQESDTQTRAAGSVAHLCTTFQAKLPSDFKMEELVSKLHPTPAVGGQPRAQALDLIKQTEKHQRGLYAGFLGINSGKQTDLFVNLRCMQIFDSHFDLHVGGGLTSESQVDAEWEETLHKARTLLSVIEKIR